MVPPIPGGQPDLQRHALLQMMTGQPVEPPPSALTPPSAAMGSGAPTMIAPSSLLPPGFTKPKPFVMPRADGPRGVE